MDFLFYIDNSYNSLFYNMCNNTFKYEIIFILKNKYNINLYFLNYLNLLENQYSYYNLIFNNYNIYYFKFYIIYYLKHINKINIWNSLITNNLNIYIKYNIINKLPNLPNIFYFLNSIIDKNIFPNKNTFELYFLFKQYNFLNFSDYINLSNYINISNFNLIIWKKAGIINYLILNNIYLLQIKNNWYERNFHNLEYLNNTLPFYWDYDYILGINKYLNYFKIQNIYYFDLVNTKIQNNFNFDIIENFNYFFLIKLIIQFLFSLNIYILNIFCLIYVYTYLILIYINNYINYLLKIKNINILLLHNILWIEDYTLFYFLNPIYLYIGRKSREIIYWYIDLINKKNLIIATNNKNCDKNEIFYFDFIFHSYIKYITFLIFTLFLKYLYIFLNIIIYNIKFIWKFNIKFLNFILNFHYLISYIKIYIIIFKHTININILKNFLNKFNYIYLNWINFSIQFKLLGNDIIITFLNFIRKKELDSYKFNNILNQKEYINKNFFKIINSNFYYINIYFLSRNLNKLHLIYQIYIDLLKYQVNLFKSQVNLFKYLNKLQVFWKLICNLFKYLNKFKKILYLLGCIIYYILWIFKIIISRILINLIKILFNIKTYLIFIIIIIMYILNWDINLVWLIIDNFIYEFNWNSFYTQCIYNNIIYNINEWTQYKINFIIETIKLNINFIQSKQDIWNNLFINLNFHKKKWQNVTSDKKWNFINPIYFLIFLIYELQIQWIINELINYLKISLLIYTYLKFLPLLYWVKLDFVLKYLIYYCITNIFYIFYLLKCYYTYIYIYKIPNYTNKLISKIIFYNIYKIIFIKISLLKIYNSIITILFILLLNWIIKIYIICKNFNNTNSINLFILLLILKTIYNNILNLYNLNEILYYNFHFIYLFINGFYKIQNNLDIIYSYLRLDKNKIYKWNKFSKKKKTFRYYLNSFLIEQFYSLTYEDNLITLSTYIKESSLIRFNIIDNFTNINIYIKYLYITSNNFLNTLLYNIFELRNIDNKQDIIEMKLINEWNFQYNIVYNYSWYWWVSKMHYNFYKKYLLNITYYNIFEIKYKLFINHSKINTKILIYFLVLIYIFFSLIFLFKYNNKHNINNTEFLWYLLNKKEKLNNNLFNFKKTLNKWFNFTIKDNSSKIKKQIIYIFNNLTFKYSSKFIFFIKEKNINLKKLYIDFFLKKSLYINWINLKKFEYYINNFNRNNSFLTLLCLLLKNNHYAYLIIKQELNSYNIPLNITNYYIQKNININIWLYFNYLNEKLFHLNNTWILNKNSSSIFTFYREGKCYIKLQLNFPSEKNYFIFFILFIFIYYKIIIFNIIWNQKYWIGSSIYDKQVFFNYLINQILSIKITNYLNSWQYINASTLNSNSNWGIISPQFYIYIYNNKFYNIYKSWEYENFNTLNIKFYSKLNINYYLIFEYIILILSIFLIKLGIKFIYKKDIFKFFFITINKKIFFKLNKEKFKYIFLHYKFKKMLFNKVI